MNVLVTGGAGYIGSNTCKALAQAGHTPIVYDNLSTGFERLVQWGPFINGDILDITTLRKTMREHTIEAVIHFAALSNVGESVRHPSTYYRNNVGGSATILEAMHEENIRHIVVSSTCAIFGMPQIIPIAEETPFAPITPYGRTKATMEHMLNDQHTAHGICFAALRYFNAAGADLQNDTGESHDPEFHLIPRVLMAAHNAVPQLEIFGDDYPTPDGTCVRDYIHVADLASAHILALEHIYKQNTHVKLNLGTGTGYSVRDILTTAERILGMPIPHMYAERRPGDPPVLIAKAGEAERVLGWKPHHSDLDTIIRTAAAWYEKDHR